MIKRLSFHVAHLIINTALFALGTNSFIACPHVNLELKTIPKYLQRVAESPLAFSTFAKTTPELLVSFEFNRGVSNQSNIISIHN